MTKKKSNAGRKPYADRSQIKKGVRFAIKQCVIDKYGKDGLLKPEVLEDNK
jgi:hypothetical protein